ncbi:unnamed protein product [Meloidogyne enterolobii]|uniref:Uncharacterized protein n=1 Tax=Meloidogyne enterolobii TaxID=390850 RepID=A0ACB1B0C0_MELEN
MMGKFKKRSRRRKNFTEQKESISPKVKRREKGVLNGKQNRRKLKSGRRKKKRRRGREKRRRRRRRKEKIK